MKICSECQSSYPDERLVCLECDEVLEDSTYIHFVWVTVTVGALGQLALSRLGLTGSGFWKETLMNGSFLIAIAYPGWKVIQRLREPSRPIFAEMGSVFAGRLDRLLLLGLFTFLISAAPTLASVMAGNVGEVTANGPAWWIGWRILRTWTLVLIGGLVPIAAMIDQGWAFFDPRVANTYANKEARRLLIADDERQLNLFR